MNYVDPDGTRVKVSNTDVLDIMRKTVPVEAREFITIDENNYIVYNVMKNYNGDSINFRHLKEMVQNTKIVSIGLSDHFILRSRGGELEMYYMDYTGVDYLFVDKEIEQTSGLTTGETGFYGKTLFPGTHAVQNSPDSNIHVIINPLFSEIGKIEGFCHEFYGHAYIFMICGSYFLATHSRNTDEKNYLLKYYILNSRKEAVGNNFILKEYAF